MRLILLTGQEELGGPGDSDRSEMLGLDSGLWALIDLMLGLDSDRSNAGSGL